MGGVGLTKKEIKEVRRVWAIATSSTGQHPGQHGVEILMTLFSRYPEYLTFFKRLDGITLEELRHTPLLRFHASSFMHGITVFLDKVENKKELTAIVHDNVLSHYPRKIRYEQYSNALHLVPEYLSSHLADDMTPEAKSGWRKIVDCLCNVIHKKLVELESQDSSSDSGDMTSKPLNPLKTDHHKCVIS